MKDELVNEKVCAYIECVSSDLAFAADSTDPDKIPSFKMTAYTGGEIKLFGRRIVVRTEGIKFPNGVPIRMNHDIDQGVGHTTSISIEKGSKLVVEGIISRATAASQDVVESSKMGFPWEASVGLDADACSIEFIPEKTKVKVNGRMFVGPLTLMNKSELVEVSFVDKGANPGTKVRVAASEGVESMLTELEKAELAKKKALEASDPSGGGDGKIKVEAVADVPKLEPAVIAPVAPVVAPSEAPVAAPVVAVNAAADLAKEAVQAIRSASAGEMERIKAIEKVSEGGSAEIQAKAVAEGWGVETCELAQLRASRSDAPAVHVSASGPTSNEVLECALCTTGDLKDVEKNYSDEVNQAAHTRFRGNIGLQEILLEAAWAHGSDARMFKTNPNEVIKSAFGERATVQAGVSLIDISGILSNVANKFLLEGYSHVEEVWKLISSRRPVNDFKTITSYRLTGSKRFELIAPGGTIKHGTSTEESYTNKADTYGRLLSIDRRDIINDDMGALTQTPRDLGRGAATELNKIFWTKFLANAGGTHFHADNSNVSTGAGSALGVAGLTAAELLFLNQTDTEGEPLGVMPQLCLVPTALSVTANILFKSAELRNTTSSTIFMTQNPHANRFTPVVSAYLGNSAYTNYSTAAWYLLADPRDLPTIEVVFLNGQEVPTVETAELNFNTLGIQMRGYFDFGVNLQDPNAGVRSAGS